MAFPDEITLDALEDDPFPIYARLRKEFPVAFVPAADVWFVTRWEDVQTVTRSPDLFTADAEVSPVDLYFGRPNILSSEGDQHKALRGGFEPHYRPKKVATYIDALVEPLADEFLARFEKRGSAELMSEYFEPISILSLAQSLGFGDVDLETLKRWFDGLGEGATNFEKDPAKAAACDAVSSEIEALTRPILARLRKEPDDTPMSQMLHFGMTDGETRPDEFILPSIKVALLGGMQEPGHGAGSAMVGLFQNPDQLAQVIADPEQFVSRAATEGVRWIAPIGTQFRIARQDVEIAGVTIPKGASVTALLASANRDETQFEDPDRFDMHRKAAGAVSFGLGHHFCAGRWFAMGQIEIVLRKLLERFPDIQLASDEPVPFRGWEFRAARKLNVTFTPRA
ncbi:MAG: cytochrome P450 [Sulfitobacter sp.]|nr:cytochrome P450 [Sulfitobacter sp.]